MFVAQVIVHWSELDLVPVLRFIEMRFQVLDPFLHAVRKKEGSVRSPSRMILMYEPPACWYINYYHWHYARGPTTVPDTELAADGQKFISPILFVDGHAKSFDFTHALKFNPNPGFPLEPTKDWYWYEPKQ